MEPRPSRDTRAVPQLLHKMAPSDPVGKAIHSFSTDPAKLSNYVFRSFVQSRLTALFNMDVVFRVSLTTLERKYRTWAASVLLTVRILFKPKVRKFFRDSLKGLQRAGSSQFRWWDEQLQSRLMCQSTALPLPDSATRPKCSLSH